MSEPRVINVDRPTAMQLVATPGAVMVSITNPGSRPAALSKWSYVLRLEFWDDDTMTQAQAERLADFVVAHDGKDIIVHCEGGVSRSHSVAKAVSDLMGYKRVGGGVLNAHVYRRVHTALANRLVEVTYVRGEPTPLPTPQSPPAPTPVAQGDGDATTTPKPMVDRERERLVAQLMEATLECNINVESCCIEPQTPRPGRFGNSPLQPALKHGLCVECAEALADALLRIKHKAVRGESA